MNFKEILNHYKRIVDDELVNFFSKIRVNDDFLQKNYFFIKEYIKDGKRLRPILLIMAYKAFCGNNKIIPASLSVELLHNSTLIHDDIMDEDEFRRNKATVYKGLKDFYLKNYNELSYSGSLFSKSSSKFAVSNAVLCGNTLLPLGANNILETNFPEKLKNKALAIYNKAYHLLNHGQFLDIIMEKKNNVTEAEYFDMIETKTARLFSASVAIGALLANAGQDEIKKLENYAKEIAIAFQLIDDIMDISKDMSKGHELGSDIKSGKRTLLVIKALESENSKELLAVLGKEDATEEEIQNAIDIINKSSLDYVKGEANKRIQKAKHILKQLDIREESKAFFNEFADYIAKRDK